MSVTDSAGARDAVPSGFRESAVGGARLVARDAVHAELRAALAGATLHAWAAARAGARGLEGRTVAWATHLDSGAEVVIRHARHGGTLRSVTGDLFLTPSRAPRELASSLRLQAAGVPTPDVVGYATYAAFGPLCRADVVTSWLDGTDFPDAWRAADRSARDAILGAMGTLVRRLRDAGAVHADLNAKNILIGRGTPHAWVLDVDRVSFHGADKPVMARNLTRLARSLAKWRARRGLDFGADDWHRLADAAGAAGIAAEQFA